MRLLAWQGVVATRKENWQTRFNGVKLHAGSEIFLTTFNVRRRAFSSLRLRHSVTRVALF